MGYPDRLIPVSRLQEGLKLCAQNVRDFVIDAEQVLLKGHGYHAVALAIFAFEELGKYSELKRLGEDANKTSAANLTVRDDLFRSHDYKQNVAKQLIDRDAMILLPAYFDSAYFDTEEVAVEPNLRLECVFVDWLEKDWRYGTPHDTERLRKFLNAIMEALSKLET